DRPTWSPFREVMNEASPLHVSILGCCHCESSVEASVVISQRPNKLSTASVCCNFSKSLLDQLDLSIECWSVFPADRRVSRYRRGIEGISIQNNDVGLEIFRELDERAMGRGLVARPVVSVAPDQHDAIGEVVNLDPRLARR